MKNSFIRLLLRDIKNYIRTNRFFLIAEAALFLIGCMIADMQKPDSYGKYTTIQYYMQIFRGCYPFTDARTEVFQVPLTWFTLMYFCIYTALLYPIRDASGAGIHVLLRAKSRALWWFSKCLALGGFIGNGFTVVRFIFCRKPFCVRHNLLHKGAGFFDDFAHDGFSSFFLLRLAAWDFRDG